jgi:hypothetical protein
MQPAATGFFIYVLKNQKSCLNSAIAQCLTKQKQRVIIYRSQTSLNDTTNHRRLYSYLQQVNKKAE